MMTTSLHFLDPNPSGNPVVLLLHGLGADASSWTLQLPALTAAGFRPIAPDAPGFGQSPYDGRDWSIRRIARVMADLVEELDVGPVDVVGLSMGGVIAQQFVLDFPYLSRKLILVSTFSVLRPESFRGWGYFLRRSFAVMTFGLRAQARIVAQHVFPDSEDAPLREMLIDNISRANPRAYWKAMLSLGMFDSRKQLRKIRIPTLVITGAQDTTVTPKRQRLLVESISGAQQVVVPQAGHAVPIDQADVFNREMLGFLGDRL